MGSTENIPLIKDIQDSVLKLCLERLKSDRTIEIDGIICISHGKQENNIVVKMHRTILKPKQFLDGSREMKTSSRLRRSIEAARDVLRQSTRRKSQRKKINFPLNSSSGDVTVEVQCNSGDDNTWTRNKRQNEESIEHLSPKSQRREPKTQQMQDIETSQASQDSTSAMDDPGFPESCVLGGIMAKQASTLDIMNRVKLSTGTPGATNSSAVPEIPGHNSNVLESSSMGTLSTVNGLESQNISQHNVSVYSGTLNTNQPNISPKSKPSKIAKSKQRRFSKAQTKPEETIDTKNGVRITGVAKPIGVTPGETDVAQEHSSRSQRLAQSLSESVSVSKLEGIKIYKYKRSPNDSFKSRQRHHVRRGSSCRTNLQNSFSKADQNYRQIEVSEKKSCISRGKSLRSQNRGVRFESSDRSPSKHNPTKTQNITHPIPQVGDSKCDMTYPMPKTTIVSNDNYINIQRKRRISGRKSSRARKLSNQKTIESDESMDMNDKPQNRSVIDAPVKQKLIMLNGGKSLDRKAWTSDSDNCDYMSMEKMDSILNNTKTDEGKDKSHIKDSTTDTQKQTKPDLFNLDRSFLVDQSRDLSHNWVKEERRTRVDSGQFPIKSNRRSFENLIISRQDKKRKSANSILIQSSKSTNSDYRPEISRRHPCKMCGKVLNSVGQLWNHQKVHEVLKCPQCREEFQDRNCFMTHFTEVHNVDAAADSLIKDVSTTSGHS
ncbi:unnamed protein product [Owenia fusiformis]|uniref:C2H2-type domain-containing protein n=1 Tax=Owenia fusiformis TaxID=6347 RepID=A0A8S4N962_OWEFU|nr:unnamed protein product [Owenia fusiformis]